MICGEESAVKGAAMGVMHEVKNSGFDDSLSKTGISKVGLFSIGIVVVGGVAMGLSYFWLKNQLKQIEENHNKKSDNFQQKLQEMEGMRNHQKKTLHHIQKRHSQTLGMHEEEMLDMQGVIIDDQNQQLETHNHILDSQKKWQEKIIGSMYKQNAAICSQNEAICDQIDAILNLYLSSPKKCSNKCHTQAYKQ